MASTKQTRVPTWVKLASLSLLVLSATALAVSIWATISIKKKHDGSDGQPHVCPKLNGNQDMYGLGIRLGIYLQLTVTAAVDVLGMQHTSLTLAPATLWFLIAMFVALLTMLRDPLTYAVESYIVISLGNGLTWVLVGGTIKLNPLTLRETFITSFGRFLICGVWRVANSVYWWTLRSATYKHVEAGCGPWAWLFVPLRLEGWYNELQKALNVLSWIFLAYSLIPYIAGSLLLLHLLSKLNIKDLTERRKLSKAVIAFDYMFVEVGQLRGIVFGGPKPNPQDQNVGQRSETDQAAGPGSVVRVGLAVDQISINLERHLYQNYQLPLPPHLHQPVARARATIAPDPKSPVQEPDLEIAIVEQPADSQARTTSSSTSRNHTKPISRSLSFSHLYWGRDRLVALLKKFNLQKFPLLPFWNGCSIIVTVLTVEFTLYINHIDGHDVYIINSAGQLVAFVTGVGGVFIAVGNFYMEKRDYALSEQLRAEKDGDHGHVEVTDLDPTGGSDGAAGERGTSYWAISEPSGPMLSFSARRAPHNYPWGMDGNEKF